MRLPVSILMLISILVFACSKDRFVTSSHASIRLSSDTLFFDTVFVTAGSVTQSVKIFNDNDGKLRLSEVRLMGGASSYFSINIDGLAGPTQTNTELAAGDSLYLFVAVSIKPGAANLPFIVQDSIEISFNGNKKYVQLQAWGQNAHFLHNQVIGSNTTWDNTLPYVITGSLRVDTNAVLTLMPGCRVYLHADAPFLVDGTLRALGDKYDSTRISFQSDRRDQPYSDYPGSWPGIYFRPSSVSNLLQYTHVRNAYQAIVVESPATNASPKLSLDQCIVDNSYDAGILGANTSILAVNSLVSNCGKNIVLEEGGSYNFIHCTSAASSNEFISHTQPVLFVSNYLVQDGATQVADLQAQFTNCIFWGSNGSVDDEVQVSRQGGNVFTVNFASCLWKVKTAPSGVGTDQMISGSDPLFDSVNNFRRYYDFHLKAASPAINKGKDAGVPVDLDGSTRPVGLPDLGCYESKF